MIIWEQNNDLKSPITWFRDEVDLGAKSRLVTRLESPFESACCENRAPLVVGSFSNDMSVTNLIDCNPSMLNHISCRKWFCFLNGAVTKNRTITKPSCQVRRLSKLKPAPIIYFLLICMLIDKACSFICRSLAVLCTWVYFVVHAITQPIGMALNRSMQSPGKVTQCHMYDSLVALGNEESTSYLLGFRTANVKDGSRSSHLFFIIKATCNSFACFGWDTQVCILAIGTRDVSNKWVSKYASDLERISLSTFTKTGGTTSNSSFPYPWVRQLHLD